MEGECNGILLCLCTSNVWVSERQNIIVDLLLKLLSVLLHVLQAHGGVVVLGRAMCSGVLITQPRMKKQTAHQQLLQYLITNNNQQTASFAMFGIEGKT